MNNMKIAAWSDGHGVLPKIKEYADVLIIAGDFTPLDIQRQTNECLKWFTNEFFNYVRKVNCKKVLLVPGNHDFLCERISPKIIKEMIENNADIKDKLVYLIDEEYQYKGLKFYGTPWCINLHNWAFYTEDPKTSFSHIPQDCDVLITHQPPKIDRVGCSNPYTAWEQNFGSDSLRDAIEQRNIKYVFCGHVHSGIHQAVNFVRTTIYNVSILNENYVEAYRVLYVDL